MTRQDQRVSEGGQAIQAQGDVNVVNQGITPEQMITIMDGVARQVQRGVDQAALQVEQRLNAFEEAVLQEFAQEGGKGDAEAFKEPDFQYALKQAQVAYARHGDDGLKDELVKLLAERSAAGQRSRKALILNEAISSVGNLTPQDISALVFLFLVKHVGMQAMNSASVVLTFGQLIDSFVADFPPDNFSYEYLESVRCVTVNPISHVDLWDPIQGNFGYLFTAGFTRAELDYALKAISPLPNLGQLVVQFPNDYTGRLRFGVARSVLEKDAAALGVDGLGPALLSLYDEKALPIEAIKSEFFRTIPSFERVSSLWETTLARQSNLTALGKVIAHSALTSRTPFDAPLEIWAQ